MGKSLLCPGFRFKPTDVELTMFYLKKKLLGKKLDPQVITEINIYDFSPWDLPAKSILSGDLEWYFFCSQSKKYSSGSRMNRATETGYWKGTGKDREVKYNGRTVAVIKSLIFHVGHPPKGTRTNWVMHEYRMKDENLTNKGVAQEAYVICKVFEKRGAGPQNGAQYGAPFEEEEWDDNETCSGAVSLVVNPNNGSCSSLMNLTSPEPLDSYASGSSLSAAVTSFENEKHIDHPCNHDDMLTHGDVALLVQNNNTQSQEVEDGKGKKVMSDDIFEELAAIEDLGQDAFNMFSIDGSADDNSLDAFLPDDDFWKLLED